MKVVRRGIGIARGKLHIPSPRLRASCFLLTSSPPHHTGLCGPCCGASDVPCSGQPLAFPESLPTGTSWLRAAALAHPHKISCYVFLTVLKDEGLIALPLGCIHAHITFGPVTEFFNFFFTWGIPSNLLLAEPGPVPGHSCPVEINLWEMRI